MSAKEKKLAAVQSEIARERAESLSRSASRLRRTLEALRRFDDGPQAGRSRSQLVHEASEACLAYVVQREVMGFGMQDVNGIRKDFDVPKDVWNAMGALRSA
jgi:hypothetical protein